MSAPAASGLFHVSSSLPTGGGALLVAGGGGGSSSSSSEADDPALDHDALFRGKASRSQSFAAARKPVVLFALDKKPEDRGSSGSNSSSTSTASTGSHGGDASGVSSNAAAAAAITQPPTHPKEPRKSIRKSASSIIASSLGIVGNAATGSSSSSSSGGRGSLAKSSSSTNSHATTVLSMASSSGSAAGLSSPTGSATSSNGGGGGVFGMRSSSATSSQHPEEPAAAAAALELSAERQAALVEFVDKSVDDAYNLCHGFGRIRWHAFKTREGVSICRAHGEDDQRLDAAVRGKCNVNATFHEMMDLLTTETTAEFVQHESAVNPSEFLDGQVLQTLVPRSADDRFVCLKWHCIKSLAPSVAKHRDYVYVEVVDQFVDQDGKRIGYRLAKSVELDEMAAMDTSHLFVRGKTLTVQTFSEVSQGNLELFTMMINDLGERLPTWLAHKIVDTAAMRVACVRDHINQRRIDLLVFTNPRDLVPLTRRVCCVVCTKSFSLMRKKYNCVACGEVICNQCSVHQLVTAQGLSEFVGKRKARICIKCSSGLTTTELPRRSNLRQSDLTSEASTARSSLSLRHSGERQRPGTDIESRHSRAMSSLDRSSSFNGSFLSNEDSGSRVHPAGAGSRPSTIPHMFQFRGAPAKPVAPPPAPVPAPVEAVQSAADAESEEDDDMEHELFDANVDITAIAPQDLDLGVGRYKEVYVQQSQSERAVDCFLSGDAEDAEVGNFLVRDSVVAAPGTIISSMEELFVEEIQPGNRGSSFGQPRRSVSLAAAPDADADDEPVIVRKVEKLSIGSGGRKSREIKRPRAPPPPLVAPPAEATETADFTTDFTADFTVPVESVEVAAAADDSIQLSDLQVHLDRMTQISQSLRQLNPEKIEPSIEATVAMRRLESFERRANADVAAVIAANFLSVLDKNASPLDRPAYVPAAVQPTGPPRFILTLAMGDGSFVDFLPDSTISDFAEPVDGILAGWKTVVSHTTGKVYYFNAACGATSWTMPVPEMHRGAVYMVL